MSNAAMIGESNFEQNHLATDQGTSGFANNAAVASVLNAIAVNMGWSNEYFNQDFMSGGTVSNNWNGQGTDATVWLYSSTTYLGSSATTYTGYTAPQLYSSSGGYSGTVSVNPISSATNLYLGFVFSASAGFPADIYYNWDRARAYPPSNVMPSTSFGSLGVGNGVPSSVTDTLGNAFTIGVSNTVTGGAPTLIQKNYNSNCNSASCGLAFTSNVVAGNTLVFGLGWYCGGKTNPPITSENLGACFPVVDCYASAARAHSPAPNRSNTYRTAALCAL